jgi:thiamine-monophosphate kinase
LNERQRLERLRALFGQGAIPLGITVGIGDDAAVLAPGAAALVWTVDAVVEEVHFRRGWLSFEDLGWRSLMAAASDLAAMGASPRGVLSALVLPNDVGDADLEALARGQADAARELGTAVIGGNLARGGELSITTTVLGEVAVPVLRSGAREGDAIAVAGPLGLAAAGVEALRSGSADARVAPAVDAYRRPRARIAEGLVGARAAHAAIDVSDGLALDLSRLAEESGVGIVLEEGRLIEAGGAALVEAAAALSLVPIDLALHGGEDYALVMTFAPGEIPEPFARIGRCVREAGVFIDAVEGGRFAVAPRGFDHFQ